MKMPEEETFIENQREQKEITEEKERSEPSLPFEQESYSLSLNIASLRERLSSAFVDLFMLFYLYWIALFVYRYFVWGELFGPIPVIPPHSLIFHSIFFFIAFLYFFISEGVFFTSLGKFCNWLSVRKSDGSIPSLFSIFTRTLFRPIDYLLFLFPGWILLEKTKEHKRIGDLFAGTAIVKSYRRSPRLIFSERKPASTTLRTFAGILDIGFLAGWVLPYSLLLSPDRPFLNFLLILFAPLVLFLWFVLWEILGQTTPGKWIAGLQLIQENGRNLSFSGAFWRTFFRPLDANPFAWLTLLLSSNQQRPGDLAAGSLVVHTKRTARGIIGISISFALIATLWAFAQNNRANFLTRSFGIKEIVQSLQIPFQPTTAVVKKTLFIDNFVYLKEDGSFKTDDKYLAGETALIRFKIDGFLLRDNAAWVQVDITVHFPDGSIALKQDNVLDFHQELQNPNAPIQMSTTIALRNNTPEGRYALTLSIRDRLSGKQLTQQKFFQVVPR